MISRKITKFLSLALCARRRESADARVQPLESGIIACGLLGLSPLLLLVVELPGVIIAFAVFHGLGHGGIASFQPLIMAGAFGTKYIGNDCDWLVGLYRRTGNHVSRHRLRC